MSRKIIVLVYLVLLILSACSNGTSQDSPLTNPSSASCRSITPEDQAVLLANVAKLQIGDSQSRMLSLLGKPGDVDHGLAKPTGRITGTDYVYFVKKCGDGSHAGWDDDYVRLTFGTDDKLELIQGIRVPGVITRSVPSVN